MNMFELPVEKRNSVCGEVYRPTKMFREGYMRKENRRISTIQQQTKDQTQGYFSERAQSQAPKANKTDLKQKRNSIAEQSEAFTQRLFSEFRIGLKNKFKRNATNQIKQFRRKLNTLDRQVDQSLLEARKQSQIFSAQAKKRKKEGLIKFDSFVLDNISSGRRERAM